MLAWLLDAEERFGAADEVGNDVIVVKDQFHAHEDFMMQLTDHQNNVGNVLQEGICSCVKGNPSVLVYCRDFFLMMAKMGTYRGIMILNRVFSYSKILIPNSKSGRSRTLLTF